MSFNRLIFASMIVGYLWFAGNTSQAMTAMAIYFVLALGVLAHILIMPRSSNMRRGFAMLLDFGFLSWQAHLGDKATAALFPIYLWVVFGNGFRFGIVWLRVSTAIGFACFLAVVLTTQYWQTNVSLSVGLLIGLIILPLYAGTLIRRLSEARQIAEQASRAKTMFLASVSHELRTPLNAIIGTTCLLQETAADPAERDMVGTIDTAAASLLTLIDSILDFSRLEAGLVAIQSTEFDLLELLAEVRRMVAVQAKQKGLRLSFHVTTRTPLQLRGERRRLQEILLNLAGNALKFTHAGSVAIAVDIVAPPADTGGLKLRFQVSDTGIGVSPEGHDRIFDSFVQADETIINRYGGTGLGLAICKRLVAALGGEIGIASALGSGSTFWFTVGVEPADRIADPGATADELILLSLDRDLIARFTAAAAHLHPARTFAQAKERLAASDATGRRSVVMIDPRDVGGDPAAIAESLRALADDHRLSLVLVDSLGPGSPPDLDRIRTYATVLDGDAGPADVQAALRIAALGWSPAASAAPVIAVAVEPLHILVADDNVVNQKVLQKIFERAGHHVRTVGDGEAALDALEKGSFAVVIMDMNMPVMDGVEATKMYRMLTRGRVGAAIIGLTADATKEAAERCLEAGMDACLTKPIDPVRLLDTVAAVVRKSAPSPTVTAIASHPRYRPADSAAAVDAKILANLTALGGPAFLAELTETFLAKADTLLDDLNHAAAAGDLARFRAAAHALASAGANLGTTGLVDLCRAAQASRQDALPVIIEGLTVEMGRVRAAFQRGDDLRKEHAIF